MNLNPATLMCNALKLAFFICLLFNVQSARATHSMGGEITYIALGNNNYKITLTTYQDCQTGDPDAIHDDNPAFLHIFTGTGQFVRRDSVPQSAVTTITPIYTGCGTPPASCIKKAVFIKTLNLPASASGYSIVYQRCCRNAGITNVINALAIGTTLYCTIPSQSMLINTSAAFNNSTQTIVCTNNEFTIDNSATDADGDSLSYEFCQLYIGGTSSDAKPRNITPPPYAVANYNGGYSYSTPITGNPAMSIDSATGVVTGKPNLAGKYLVGVACHEWRYNNIINTVRTEYEVLVTSCPGNLLAYVLDTTVLAGATINFSAPAGGMSYAWHPGVYLSDSTIPNPTGFYPDAGNFIYDLETDGVAGCSRNDTIKVHVATSPVLFMPTAFSPNGDGVNDIFKPKSVGPYIIKYLRVFDRNGQMVSDDISGWDGSYKGSKLSMGSYVWTMQYMDKDGAINTTKGTITLIR